jgi:sulfur-carrier protein adenylyltransferase/sulfurtransferase
MIELSPKELNERQLKGFPVMVIDIREDWEREISQIKNSDHIPMSSLKNQIDCLPKDKDIILFCHSGVRSLQAALWLQEQGFKAISLKGGINAWAEQIDPSIPIY